MPTSKGTRKCIYNSKMILFSSHFRFADFPLSFLWQTSFHCTLSCVLCLFCTVICISCTVLYIHAAFEPNVNILLNIRQFELRKGFCCYFKKNFMISQWKILRNIKFVCVTKWKISLHISCKLWVIWVPLMWKWVGIVCWGKSI